MMKLSGIAASRTILLILMVAACAACSVGAVRGKTHVLVVASDYNGAAGEFGALDNTLRDAENVTNMFARIRRVNVRQIKNPTTDQFIEAIEQLAERRSPGDTVMLYFAGHGLQANGQSYLVSSDGTQGFQVDNILNRLMLRNEQQNDPTIFVIDACRNNPIASDSKPHNSARAGTWSIASASSPVRIPPRGAVLAPQAQSGPIRASLIAALGENRSPMGPLSNLEARNALVLFSTLPGRVAEDGVSGEGSEFAQIFVEEMPKRESLDVIFNRISKRVSEKTEFRQNPWPQGVTNRKVYIAGKPRRAVPFQ